MRPTRTLAVAAAFALSAGLAGCASAGAAGSDTQQATPAVPSPSADRKALATAEATRILGTFRPPAGAHRLTTRPTGTAALSSAAIGDAGTHNEVDQVQWWRVPGAPQHALAGLGTPAGAHGSGTGSSSSPSGTSYAAMYTWPSGPVLDSRSLSVSAARNGEDTVLRVDAVVTWLPPRPSDSLVPVTAHVVTAAYTGARPLGTTVRTASIAAVTSADPGVVATIAHAVNAQPMAQTGARPCPAMMGARMVLTFRDAPGGPVVATVTAIPDGCGTALVTTPGGGRAVLSGGRTLMFDRAAALGMRLPVAHPA